MASLTFYVQGVMASMMESLGLSLFSILVVGTSHDYLQAIFFMNGVFIVPVIHQLYKEGKKYVKLHMVITCFWVGIGASRDSEIRAFSRNSPGTEPFPGCKWDLN